MAGIAQGLISVLAAAPAVVEVIGDRVYPAVVRMADKVYPLITYKVDNVTTINTYDGPANALRSCNVILACIGQDYGDVDNLASVILTVLDGSDGTWGTTTVQGCFLNEDSIADDVVTDAETEEVLFYVKELSFLVWYVAA